MTTHATGDRAPDPHAVLRDWLAGTYTRHDGLEARGRAWDEDTRYRYHLWVTSWLDRIGDHAWHPTPHHIRNWASHLTNLDGTPMAEAGRLRAVSAVTSYYRHCEDNLGAHPWNLPPRRHLIGPTPNNQRTPLTPHQTDALRTAADRYQGPHPERARLATYLLLAGLRPGQATGLWLNHIHRDDQHHPTWRIPAKNNHAAAVDTLTPIPRPVTWAIDDYLPARTWRPPTSTHTTGPLLLSRLGQPLDRVTLPRLIRQVAATHPDLTDIAPALTPDTIAHSPTPFA